MGNMIMYYSSEPTYDNEYDMSYIIKLIKKIDVKSITDMKDKIKLNYQNSEGDTLLMIALKTSENCGISEFISLVRILLELSDPNIINHDGKNALMIALSSELNEEIINELIPVTNLNIINYDGKNALMMALSSGLNEEMIDKLIPVTNLNITDLHGDYAWFYGIKHEYPKNIIIQLVNNTNVHYIDTIGRGIYHLLLEYGSDISLIIYIEETYNPSKLIVDGNGRSILNVILEEDKYNNIIEKFIIPEIINVYPKNTMNPINPITKAIFQEYDYHILLKMICMGAEVNIKTQYSGKYHNLIELMVALEYDQFIIINIAKYIYDNCKMKQKLKNYIIKFINEHTHKYNNTLNYTIINDSDNLIINDSSSSNKFNDDKLYNNTVNKCVVCLENYSKYIFIACGHLCVCKTCNEKIKNKCPLCRCISVTKLVHY